MWKSSIIIEGINTMARTPIHPGEILADELNELGVSVAELARALRVPANRMNRIVAGKRAITADIALRLGRWLGTGPELWLNLQKSYELRLAQQQVGKDIKKIIPRRQPTLPKPMPMHP
jgi:addiction module HigA family antidote